MVSLHICVKCTAYRILCKLVLIKIYLSMIHLQIIKNNLTSNLKDRNIKAMKNFLSIVEDKY